MEEKEFDTWELAIEYAMQGLTGKDNHKPAHRRIIHENNKYKVIEVKWTN